MAWGYGFTDMRGRVRRWDGEECKMAGLAALVRVW